MVLGDQHGGMASLVANTRLSRVRGEDLAQLAGIPGTNDIEDFS
jgi:hypothetical protein